MILRTYKVKLHHNMQMIIPIEMRKLFGNNFVITEWDGYLLAIHYPTWLEIENKCNKLDRIGIGIQKFLRFFMFSGAEIQINKKGSVKIPDSHCEYAKLRDEIIIASVGNYARIMTPSLWYDTLSDPDLNIKTKGILSKGYIFKNDDRKQTLHDYTNKLSVCINDLKKYCQKKDYISTKSIVAGILNYSNIEIVELCQHQKDGSIDIIIHLPHSENNEVLYVQCKANSRKVGVKDIRELIGVVDRDSANAGLLVSTAGFTEKATYESNLSKIRVKLIKAYEIADWLNIQNQLNKL